MSSRSQITYARVKSVLMRGVIRTSVGLAIMWALLAVVVLWPRDYQPIELGFSQQKQAINSARALAASSTLAADFESAAILRPLFVEGRNPIRTEAKLVDVKPPLTESETSDMADYNLVGVFGSGPQAGAMLVNPEGDVLRVTISDAVSGWELIEVGQRSATFRSMDNGKILGLELPINALTTGLFSSSASVSGSQGRMTQSRGRTPPSMGRRNGPRNGKMARGSASPGASAPPTFGAIEAQRKQALESKGSEGNEDSKNDD